MPSSSVFVKNIAFYFLDKYSSRWFLTYTLISDLAIILVITGCVAYGYTGNEADDGLPISYALYVSPYNIAFVKIHAVSYNRYFVYTFLSNPYYSTIKTLSLIYHLHAHF